MGGGRRGKGAGRRGGGRGGKARGGRDREGQARLVGRTGSGLVAPRLPSLLCLSHYSLSAGQACAWAAVLLIGPAAPLPLPPGPRFEVALPAYLSPAARDLLRRLLVRQPRWRLGCGGGGAAEVMGHPWFGGFDWAAYARRDMEPPRPAEVRFVAWRGGRGDEGHAGCRRNVCLRHVRSPRSTK